MNKWYFSVCATLFTLGVAGTAQAQQAAEQSSGTKIIIIEEKIDAQGNKSVTRVEREGNFTDEEINQIIAEENGGVKIEATGAGHTEKGYLGVMIENATGGVRITEVVEGSPAQAAGLKTGDVIVAIGDAEVSNMESLVGAVSAQKPGQTVQVHYLRDGASATVQATLAGREAPVISDAFGWDEHISKKKEHESDMKQHGADMKQHDADMKRHDMMMKEHDTKLKAEKAMSKSKPRFGVSIDEAEGAGVVVTHVYEGSLAEEAGIQEGDVITTFNGVKVNTANELIEAVKGAPADKKVKVAYTRDGKKEKEKVVFERS